MGIIIGCAYYSVCTIGCLSSPSVIIGIFCLIMISMINSDREVAWFGRIRFGLDTIILHSLSAGSEGHKVSLSQLVLPRLGTIT
jgi:hypothetical protein